MNKFFSIHCGNKKLYTSLRSNPMIKCRCMDLHEVAYLFSSFLWTLCQVFLSDITQGSFSFAPLGDGENSWITNKCQGLPLQPLNRPYNTRPYNTRPYVLHQSILHQSIQYLSDNSKPSLLFEFFCGTPPSCLKVMGWGGARVYVVEPESMWRSQSLCGGP